ncbi:MAG: DNA-binding response regulator [Bacteroidetes bacterium]|nr:MAG: DNA-binding response regulator [Bacteroidota bacterium]
MNRTRILYAEDEPFLGKVVKESLESRGYEVCMIADGAAVVPTCVDFRPHICLLDVMLPHRDGFSIGQELRQRAPGLPIIYLTAKTQTADLLQGFAAGGNDYFLKPFSLEELVVRIENQLQLAGKGKGQPLVVHLGLFTFYPDRLELHHPDETRKLSHREAQLLQLLTAQSAVPVARQDLLLAIWGYDSFFNSRNLDVYIARLRRYLRHDPAVQILTLKGVGYRVVRP